MKNTEIARLFDGIGTILELQNENPFRVRAYERAARSLEGLSDDLARLAERKELRSIPGIGPDLEGKILEYLKTGKIRFYEELRSKTPGVLLEMLSIPGVGPSRARAIYDRFRPKDLPALESLCRSGKIIGFSGIQEKSCRNILQGIEELKKHGGRILLGRALPLSRRFMEALKKGPGVSEIETAGSIRRRCETIRDIDILVASSTPAKIMERFVKMEGVYKIQSQGATKSSVLIDGGVQVDLRVVKKESFGAALLYFTGSRAHNVALRGIAKKKRLKLNEYGLFKEKTGRSAAAATEEEIYKALGLSWVPPELREDQGEIDAALKGKIPELVEEKDLRGDLHMHSNWTDGAHTIEDMVASAKKRGLEYMALTDHSQSLRVAGGLKPKDLLKQIGILRKLNARMSGMTILAGSEVDILSDGSLDYEDALLKKLDFAVASIHSGFKQSKEQITRRIVRAMENPNVRVIAHPTGRRLKEREPYEVDLDAVFAAAKRTGTALEINGCPQRLDLSAANARRAREAGVRFIVSTDSHTKDQLAAHPEFGAATARRAWCAKKDVLNCLPLKDFLRATTKTR